MQVNLFWTTIIHNYEFNENANFIFTILDSFLPLGEKLYILINYTLIHENVFTPRNYYLDIKKYCNLFRYVAGK